MIKEEIITKQHTIRKKYCDECETELKRGLACSVAKCEYCRKDLCDKCIGHEDYSGGDYRIVYCKTCWEIGESYRPTIEKYHNEIDKLYDEWQTKCKIKKQ